MQTPAALPLKIRGINHINWAISALFRRAGPTSTMRLANRVEAKISIRINLFIHLGRKTTTPGSAISLPTTLPPTAEGITNMDTPNSIHPLMSSAPLQEAPLCSPKKTEAPSRQLYAAVSAVEAMITSKIKRFTFPIIKTSRIKSLE